MEGAFENANMSIADVDGSQPVVVNFGDSYVGWSYKHSNELSTIRKALFKIHKFNQKLLALSSQILQSPQLDKATSLVFIFEEKMTGRRDLVVPTIRCVSTPR